MTIKKAKTTKPDASRLTPEQSAKAVVNPAFACAAAMQPLTKNLLPDIDLLWLMEELKNDITAVQSGDLSGMEAMLLGQAKALETIFASLARKGSAQEYLKPYQLYMGLALKAQAQSRATIQALVELKYPRQVVITNQANIAHGPQQVNNGVSQSQPHNVPAREEDTENNQIKLSRKETYELSENSSTSSLEGATYTAVETMGEIDRTKNRAREGTG